MVSARKKNKAEKEIEIDGENGHFLSDGQEGLSEGCLNRDLSEVGSQSYMRCVLGKVWLKRATT